MGQRLRITHDKKKSSEDQTFIMMLEKYVESVARGSWLHPTVCEDKHIGREGRGGS